MDPTNNYLVARVRMAELHAEAQANRLAGRTKRDEARPRRQSSPNRGLAALGLLSIRLGRRIGQFAPRSESADCN